VISSYLNVTLLTGKLIKKKYFAFEKKFFTTLFKIFLSALTMAVAILWLNHYLRISGIFNPLINLMIVIGCGMLAYLASSYLFGIAKIVTNNLKLSK
jgi:peptidoglycan biosynthesis protein MviN/MurJ (putative lipid II flippase)